MYSAFLYLSVTFDLLGGIIRSEPASLMCFSLKMCRSPLLFSKALECAFNFTSMALDHALNCFSGIRLTISRQVMDSYQTWFLQFIYTDIPFCRCLPGRTGQVYRTGRPVPSAAPVSRGVHCNNSSLCIIQDPMNNSAEFHYSSSPVVFTGIPSPGSAPIWLEA